jgi:hypothetical protein
MAAVIRGEIMKLHFAMVSVMMMVGASMPASSEPRAMAGYGLTSCGTWTQARQAHGEAKLEAWVLGYLSGLNMDSTHPDALNGTDFDGLNGWIDNYCKAKPLQALALAALDLMHELQLRAARR